MGLIDGFLGGWVGRHREIEQDQIKEAEQAALRESKVFESLINSPDPEIKARAAVGLIESAKPRKRKTGIGGIFDKYAENPVYPDLLRFIQTEHPYKEWVPGTPTEAPLAQPSTSPTETGTPQMTAPQPPPQPTPLSRLQPADMGATPDGTVSPLQPISGPGAPSVDATGVEPPSFTAQPTYRSVATPPPAPPPAPPPRGSYQTVYRRPNVFPTTEDTAAATYRGRDRGEYEAAVERYRRAGEPDPEQAAADYMAQQGAGGRGAMPFQSMELEYTGPDGKIVRTLGSYNKRTRQYVDSQGNPITGNITKAIPFSALSGGTAVNQAMNEFHVTPLDMRNDPELATAVNQRAEEITAERTGANTTARADALKDAPLSTTARTTRTGQLQTAWNRIQAPTRTMEMGLRIMEANYKRYKAGDKTAWEPMRTAFVHISEPNSVVMPSEFLRAAGVLSLAQQIWGFVGKTVKGGAPLPEDQVDEMMREARDMWSGMQTFGSQQRSAIESEISDPRVNIPAEHIFGTTPRYEPDFGEDQTAQPPPKVDVVPNTPKVAPVVAAPNSTPAPGGTYVAPNGKTTYVEQNGKWIKVP
jgi:hypothetical protein